MPSCRVQQVRGSIPGIQRGAGTGRLTSARAIAAHQLPNRFSIQPSNLPFRTATSLAQQRPAAKMYSTYREPHVDERDRRLAHKQRSDALAAFDPKHQPPTPQPPPIMYTQQDQASLSRQAPPASSTPGIQSSNHPIPGQAPLSHHRPTPAPVPQHQAYLSQGPTSAASLSEAGQQVVDTMEDVVNKGVQVVGGLVEGTTKAVAKFARATDSPNPEVLQLPLPKNLKEIQIRLGSHNLFKMSYLPFIHYDPVPETIGKAGMRATVDPTFDPTRIHLDVDPATIVLPDMDRTTAKILWRGRHVRLPRLMKVRMKVNTLKVSCMNGARRGRTRHSGKRTQGTRTQALKMNIHGRHVEVTPVVREYVQERLAPILQKFYAPEYLEAEGGIEEVDVRLMNIQASIKIQPKHLDKKMHAAFLRQGELKVVRYGENVYESFENALTALNDKLHKWKRASPQKKDLKAIGRQF